MNKIEIPFRLPSLNQYINECRRNKYAGANMKKNVEKDIGWFRTDIVYTTFKIIYKKEIILDMQKRGVLSERR